MTSSAPTPRMLAARVPTLVPTMRCASTGKWCYLSEANAAAALKWRQESSDDRSHVEVRYYRCEACDKFHLTSMPLAEWTRLRYEQALDRARQSSVAAGRSTSLVHLTRSPDAVMLNGLVVGPAGDIRWSIRLDGPVEMGPRRVAEVLEKIVKSLRAGSTTVDAHDLSGL